jgi:tetratricopeptide (TPR) repeat protein
MQPDRLFRAVIVVLILTALLVQPGFAAGSNQRPYTSEAYQSLTAEQKSQYDYQMNLGDSDRERGLSDAAIKAYTQASQICPGDYIALASRAAEEVDQAKRTGNLAEARAARMDLTNAAGMIEREKDTDPYAYADFMANLKYTEATAYDVEGDRKNAQYARDEAMHYEKEAWAAQSRALPPDPIVAFAGLAIAGIALSIRRKRQ